MAGSSLHSSGREPGVVGPLPRYIGRRLVVLGFGALITGLLIPYRKLAERPVVGFLILGTFVLLVLAAFVVTGLVAWRDLPVEAFPDLTNNQVVVVTEAPGLAPDEVERLVTFPIEIAMNGLPRVREVRSLSKASFSQVVVVFEDDVDTYFARQLVFERLAGVAEHLPEGVEPELGPISTGLGEIYQYVLDVEPAYRGAYDAMDLRTIQDWIVKRQLSGIPGVGEVNTWGGYLKQYEVAIKTEKLQAMNITVGQLLEALEKGNSVAGGGYIEKVNQAYFIRGEGLIGSLEDIRNTVVKTVDGLPVYVRDVGAVGFGSATRFGAITGNGEGEKVLGQVMMLKGANSKEVIGAVKERVESISKSLPEGAGAAMQTIIAEYEAEFGIGQP